ncbi:NADH:flavin oxidoreductase/NADH oxidase [Rhodoligotrophos defluvii]|uniref:NADH:flavin oxidoreductase/NADH oxidase n=1 Tax=Rhodoligotrophos defluvii TaxID=2561934 RepID=UPI0010C97D0C|nr:NADH:flavin oxidoreductase/NADH oxidase [Rhodoligotrophos defluvii]
MSNNLLTPISLGPLELKNRIAVAPMCQYSAVDGNATDWHVVHLGSLALSGAALITVEATGVEAAGRITLHCLGLYSDDNEAALGDVIARVRKVAPEAKLAIQLAHAGRKASTHVPWQGGHALSPEEGAWTTYSASALPFSPDWHTPVAMTEADLDRVEQAFVEATHRAVRIGFDVIELHSAHGYLLHQFFSPLSNVREDAYGGSLENRMRFPLRVFEAVRKAAPAGMAVGARISGSDWVEGGATPADGAAYARALEDRGAAFVDVTSGGLDSRQAIAIGPNYQVPFAAEVKRSVNIPVRAVGLITSPHQAEEIITSGKADWVALARAMLADPRWPWRAGEALGQPLTWPIQYARASAKSWPRWPE